MQSLVSSHVTNTASTHAQFPPHPHLQSDLLLEVSDQQSKYFRIGKIFHPNCNQKYLRPEKYPLINLPHTALCLQLVFNSSSVVFVSSFSQWLWLIICKSSANFARQIVGLLKITNGATVALIVSCNQQFSVCLKCENVKCKKKE